MRNSRDKSGRSTDTLTLRLPRSEAEAFRRYAAARGEPLSPLLREATLRMIRGQRH